jgi:hypothetical protein
MNSINWEVLCWSTRDGILATIDQEAMTDEIKDIIEQKVSWKRNVNNIDLENIPIGGVNEAVKCVARKAIFKSICFKQLEKENVEQLVSTMDFQSLKAKAIEKILRNTVPVSHLEGLMEAAGADSNV